MTLSKQQKLVCALPVPEPREYTDALREKYPGLEVDFYDLKGLEWNHDQIPDEAYKDATIIATLASLPSSTKAIPNIDFIQIFSAGTNHLEKSPVYRDPDVVFSNCSGIHGPPMAEWVIQTLLAHAGSYNQLHDFQKQHKWGDEKFRQAYVRSRTDMTEARIGVLGYGSIGRQVAKVASALGMQVIACTSTLRTTPESKKDNGYIVPGTGDPDGTIPVEWHSSEDKANLHKFLSQDLDALVVSTPLTKKTRHMIGKEEFEILGKKHTFLSNVARGEVIDQNALIEALRLYDESNGTKGIRGAAVDVTTPEPLPADSELWDAPNLIITPHVSGVFRGWIKRCFEIVDINIERQMAGKTVLNKIDKVKGYSSKALDP